MKNLLRMYEENQSAMVEALHKDLRRGKMEAVLLETDYLINDLKDTLHYLDEWAAPEKVSLRTLELVLAADVNRGYGAISITYVCLCFYRLHRSF